MLTIPRFSLVILLLGAGCTPSHWSSPGATAAVSPGTAAPATTPSTVGVAPDVPPRLQGGFPSIVGLAEAVLVALEHRDTGMLQSLRITEVEYKSHVFPEFPAAKGEGSIPVDFHWFHLDLRSRSGILDALDSFGGQRLDLLEVVVTQGTDQYATYRMHKKVELKVRHADGRVDQIKVFGSVVEMDGGFKILAFPT